AEEEDVAAVEPRLELGVGGKKNDRIGFGSVVRHGAVLCAQDDSEGKRTTRGDWVFASRRITVSVPSRLRSHPGPDSAAAFPDAASAAPPPDSEAVPESPSNSATSASGSAPGPASASSGPAADSAASTAATAASASCTDASAGSAPTAAARSGPSATASWSTVR